MSCGNIINCEHHLCESDNKWQKEFPKEVGFYWFYGIRYGKVSLLEKDNELELMFVEVFKGANGLTYVANGQFMYESEVECVHFRKVDLPELPEIE